MDVRVCGVVAGPVFLGIWAVQALTREGFDPGRHPVSLLALGDGGWVQIANFVVTGGLCLAAAYGLRGDDRWLARFVGVFGVGLVLAGVFVTDPGAGFPEGAPDGRGTLSWHGVLHEIGFGIAQLAWLAAAIAFARRHRVLGITAIVVTLGVALWPDLDSLSVRLVVATALQFLLIVRIVREFTADG